MVGNYHCIRFACCSDMIKSGGFGMLLCNALLAQLICVFCAVIECLEPTIHNVASIAADKKPKRVGLTQVFSCSQSWILGLD